MPTGTNTIFFIPHTKVQCDRKVSYVKPVASIRPNKTEIYQVQLTAVGDRLDYPGFTSTQTDSLTTTTILANSVISTPGAKFMTMDIKEFYYGTPLDCYEYVHIALENIPGEIVAKYKLQNLVHDGWIYI